MNEDIKRALELCSQSPGPCDGCPFWDADQCHETMLTAALEALNQADITIGYLTELNAKLAQELKNSLELKEGEKDG